MISPRRTERAIRAVALIGGDAVIGFGSLLLTVFIRRNIELGFTRALMPLAQFPLTLGTSAFFAASLVLALAMSGFYNQRVVRLRRSALGIAMIVQVAMLAIGWTLLVRPLPRTVVLGVVIFEAPAVLLWRRFVAWLGPARVGPIALVGSGEGIRAFLESLDEGGRARLDVVGIVAPEPLDLDGIEYWGNIDTPGAPERLRGVPEVLLISSDRVSDQRLRLLAVRGPRGFLFLPSAMDSILMSSSFGWLADQPLLEIHVPCGYGAAAVVKRSCDLFGAVLVAIVTLPIWVVAAAAIWLDDGTPILIRQPRTGRGESRFQMWKFRTMHKHNTDTQRLAAEGDGRITRVGLWLRRHRIDELPQLLNVLSGDMSLVGPRPEQPAIVERIEKELPEFALRRLVRPGIAGLSQVSAEYRTRSSVKLRYDLTYMRDWTLWLDFRILMLTISTVLSGRGT